MEVFGTAKGESDEIFIAILIHFWNKCAVFVRWQHYPWRVRFQISASQI